MRLAAIALVLALANALPTDDGTDDTNRQLAKKHGGGAKHGGDDEAACSGDMLLQSLVACSGVTLSAVSTAMGIPLESAEITAEGDLDFRGTLGVSKEVPIGFAAIRLRFDIKSKASDEQIATLQKLTERYCVIFQTIQQPMEIAVKTVRS